MVTAEECRWLLTLTYKQPPAQDKLGAHLTPPEHERCDRYSHVYTYLDGTIRWRTLASCVHCCRRRSHMQKNLVKRLRRLWGDQVAYLAVVENQKNGALHLHLALSGVPHHITSADRNHVKQAWSQLGGGYADLKAPPTGASSGGLGWYLGKYLAKRQDQRMARGYRRWTRARAFASSILMRWQDPSVVPTVGAPQKVRLLGWRHPLVPVMVANRVWPAGP